MGRPKSEEAIKRQKDYIEAYQRENIRRITVKLNSKTDGDIIAKVDSVSNVQGYIKDLIRKDIE